MVIQSIHLKSSRPCQQSNVPQLTSHNLCSTFFRINCRRLSNGIMQINTTITHNSSPLSALHCTDIKLSRYIKREGGGEVQLLIYVCFIVLCFTYNDVLLHTSKTFKSYIWSQHNYTDLGFDGLF